MKSLRSRKQLKTKSKSKSRKQTKSNRVSRTKKNLKSRSLRLSKKNSKRNNKSNNKRNKQRGGECEYLKVQGMTLPDLKIPDQYALLSENCQTTSNQAMVNHPNINQ